jgi:beta-glucosidase
LDAGPILQRDPSTRRWSPRAGDWGLLAGQHSPVGWADAGPLWRPEGLIDQEGVSDRQPI